MLARLREIFQSDAFIPSNAVFPDIDLPRLARELNLERRGAERGAANQPPADEAMLDPVEYEAVTAIEGLRRKGLENYEANRAVYGQRLARAGEARREIEIEAGRAVTDFRAAVEVWRSQLVDSQQRVTEAHRWLGIYRKRNRLERPAYRTGGLLGLVAVAGVLLAIEAGLNSATLAGAHEYGMLGGATMALLIASINVAISAIAGGFFREINHVNPFRKAVGTLLVPTWFFAFVIPFNLAVAHFRDRMASGADWDLAAQAAIATLRSAPFGIESIESIFLFVIGATVATGTAIKAYHAFDPYPGYRRVEDMVSDARAAYNRELQHAIGEIEDRRDRAIDALKDARATVDRNLGEAIDALYGHAALDAQLQVFLEQCNQKARALLSIYRDANRQARSADAPASFGMEFAFAHVLPPEIDLERRAKAEADREEASRAIDAAIESIMSEYDRSIHAFRDIETLESSTTRSVPPRSDVRPAASRDDEAPVEIRQRQPAVGDASHEKAAADEKVSAVHPGRGAGAVRHQRSRAEPQLTLLENGRETPS